jgi:tetratricopeptide (TPR) repeat protein
MTKATEMEARVRQLTEAGQTRKAAEECDRLNQQFPEYESGWYTASHLAMVIKEPMVALRAIDRALQLSPGKPEWLFQRIECLGALGDVAAARESAKQLSGHQFDSAGISAAFAHTLSRLGMFESARDHYARSIELEPDEGQYHYNLATVERFLGNIDAAHAAVSRCIELRPDDGSAHLLRAGLRTQTTENNNVEELQAAYVRAGEQPRRRVRLCYALAKELENIGDHGKSFRYLSEGATLRRSGMQYTPQNDLDAIQKIRETYTKEMFDGHVRGYVNAEPIFVIGMPRTGTTLVERILSSHSVVHPAGELETFAVELMKHCQMLAGEAVSRAADLVPRSASIDFTTLGEDYIAGTRPGTGNTAHFVDKLPLNFLYAGLIHLALPKAKIVLLERDPMDTCYAIYKTLFEGIYPFSYDLEELATYFAAYQKLIEHWQSVMPGVMHVVRYEELVTDPKPVVEDLLSYCSLSYEDACRRFYENRYASTTASAVQVRDDLFQSSIGSWRNYEQQLEPVMEILGVSN